MSEAKVSLRDLLNYEIDTYLSEDELRLIRQTFKYNPQLFKILRKIFIPTVHDPELPIEEMGKDLWMTGLDFQSMQNEEVKPIVLGRQEAIKFVIGGLVSLKNLAFSEEEESNEQAELRRTKDSTK